MRVTLNRVRGFSLIEMHTAMAGLTAVLVITGLLIHQTLRIDRSERVRLTSGLALDRLGHDLRADLRDSVGPVDRQDRKLLIQAGLGKTVEYLVRDRDVVRTLRVDGKDKSHEFYALPKGTIARTTSRGDGNETRIAILIEAAKGQVVDPIYRDYAIEGNAGRHARLASAEGKR